jgi:hypothetical protein
MAKQPGEIYDLKGGVLIKRKGSSVWEPAKKGAVLGDGDQLKTPPGTWASVNIPGENSDRIKEYAQFKWQGEPQKRELTPEQQQRKDEQVLYPKMRGMKPGGTMPGPGLTPGVTVRGNVPSAGEYNPAAVGNTPPSLSEYLDITPLDTKAEFNQQYPLARGGGRSMGDLAYYGKQAGAIGGNILKGLGAPVTVGTDVLTGSKSLTEFGAKYGPWGMAAGFVGDLLIPDFSDAARVIDIAKLRSLKGAKDYVATKGLNNALDALEEARAAGNVKPPHVTTVLDRVDMLWRVAKRQKNQRLMDDLDAWKTEFKASLPQPTSRQLAAPADVAPTINSSRMPRSQRLSQTGVNDTNRDVYEKTGVSIFGVDRVEVSVREGKTIPEDVSYTVRVYKGGKKVFEEPDLMEYDLRQFFGDKTDGLVHDLGVSEDPTMIVQEGGAFGRTQGDVRYGPDLQELIRNETQPAAQVPTTPVAPVADIGGMPAIRPPDGMGAPPRIPGEPPLQAKTMPPQFTPSENPPAPYTPPEFDFAAPTRKPRATDTIKDKINAAINDPRVAKMKQYVSRAYANEGANIGDDVVTNLWSKASVLAKYDPALTQAYKKLAANFDVADAILTKGYPTVDPITKQIRVNPETTLQHALDPILGRRNRRALPRQIIIDGKNYTPLQLVSYQLFYDHAWQSLNAGHPGITPEVTRVLQEKYPKFDPTLKDDYSKNLYRSYLEVQRKKVPLAVANNRPLFDAMKASTERLRRLDDFSLDYAVQGGRITQAQADAWRKKYPLHVPLYRLLPDMKDSDIGQLYSRVFKQRKGSDLITDNAIDNIVLQHFAVIMDTETNKLKLDTVAALKRLSGEAPPAGIKALPPGSPEYRAGRTGVQGQFENQALNEGAPGIPMGEVPSINLGQEPPVPLATRGTDALGELHPPVMEGVFPGTEYYHKKQKGYKGKGTKPLIEEVPYSQVSYIAKHPDLPLPKGVFFVYENGMKKYYKTPNPYLANILSMDPHAQNKVVRALETVMESSPVNLLVNQPTQTLKATATVNPLFGGKNVMRDMWTAYMNNNGLRWYNMPTDIPRLALDLPFALADQWFGGNFSTLMRVKGKTGMAGFYSNIPGISRARVTEIMQRPTLWFKIKKGASLRQNLENTLQVLESTTRLLHTRRNANMDVVGRRLGMNPKLSEQDIKDLGSLHRNITADFADKGDLIRQLDKASPFLGANIAGIRATAQAARKDPLNYASKLAAVAAVTTLYWLVRKDDEDYQDKTPQEISIDWDFGLVETPDGKTRQLRIVKPHDIGWPATEWELFLRDMYKEDPYGTETKAQKFLSDAWEHTRQQYLSPGLAPTLGVPLQLVTNKNFFFNQPIVSKSKEGLPVELQTTTNMPVVYNKLGEWLGASPTKVRFSLRGFFGPYADYVAEGYGMVTGQRPEYSERSWIDYISPVTKRPDLSSVATTEFFKAYGVLSSNADAFWNQTYARKQDKAEGYRWALAPHDIMKGYVMQFMQKQGEIETITSSGTTEGKYDWSKATDEQKQFRIDELRAEMNAIAAEALMKLKEQGTPYGTAQ